MEVIFPTRFILDEHFIKELLEDKQVASKVILKLSEIHRNSKDYPLCHNLIFDQCFLNSIKDKKIRGPALIGAMHPVSCPSFLQCEKDIESKIIRYAINIANKKPYDAIILTSNDKIKDYLKNKHYLPPISSVIKIVAGEEAIKMIEIVNAWKK